MLAVVPIGVFELPLLLKLFSGFAGLSMLMFGGGYVFIPLLEQNIVEVHGWLTRQEFVDALALSQITPGPVMISAAFVGFKLAGVAGGLVATAGMFGPPAAAMVLCTRALNAIQKAAWLQAALRGVRAATTGMVFYAAIVVVRMAAPTWISAALLVAALVALLRYRIEAVWLVLAAGLVGFFAY